MDKYKVKYKYSFEDVSEEEAYEKLLDYLREVVTIGDVTSLDFEQTNNNLVVNQ
tara:strand:+ start:1297 stop:1458 length:162 start_codon:yes stop_codon:yes gene_type:complete